MVGLFEGEAAAFDATIPPFGEIAPDWDRLAPYLEKAMSRVPAVQDVGVKKLFCGPESFTPDLAPLIGEAPELSRYFVAAGLNSIGILTGPGVGRTVAHWVTEGVPDVDVCGVHVDRARDFQATEAYRLDRVREALGDVYKCHYPSRPAWKSTSDVGRPSLISTQVQDAAGGPRRHAVAAACRARRKEGLLSVRVRLRGRGLLRW